MRKKVHYKIATEDEVLKLSKLFLDVYGKYFSKNELTWRYLTNPLQNGKIFNCIAINDNYEIVGHTALIKHIFESKSNTLYGGLTAGSAVKLDYIGIFAPMYSFLEQYCSDEFDFFYGYPNNNSYPFFDRHNVTLQ